MSSRAFDRDGKGESSLENGPKKTHLLYFNSTKSQLQWIGNNYPLILI